METLLDNSIGLEVHILSTTIATQYDLDRIAWYFDTHESIQRWSIDLCDWEKVLKLVVTDIFEIEELQRFLSSKGFQAVELAD